jgi:hypothetical protein
VLKKLGIFCSLTILSQEATGELEACERSHETQMGKGGATQAAPPGPICPSNVVSSPSFYGCLHLGKKWTPYLSHIFLRQQRRRNPSSTSRRADLLLPPEGNHCYRCHQLLLGVGRSIFIIPTSAPSPRLHLT